MTRIQTRPGFFSQQEVSCLLSDECAPSADSAFLEVMDEPADEQVSATVFQEVRSTQLFSTTVHFDLNTSIDRDSLELCWNPSVGSVHHLLDHTVSVGRVLFLPWPSLQCEVHTLPRDSFPLPILAFLAAATDVSLT